VAVEFDIMSGYNPLPETGKDSTSAAGKNMAGGAR
jgi:hypothetical protein